MPPKRERGPGGGLAQNNVNHNNINYSNTRTNNARRRTLQARRTTELRRQRRMRHARIVPSWRVVVEGFDHLARNLDIECNVDHLLERLASGRSRRSKAARCRSVAACAAPHRWARAMTVAELYHTSPVNSLRRRATAGCSTSTMIPYPSKKRIVA